MQENKETNINGFSQAKEEKTKTLGDMTIEELEELLEKADKDLKGVRSLSCTMNKMRDNLKGYLKRRRREGK